jgi:hypothetical protein
MGGVAGLLDDGLSHPPPATGAFAYNTFVPANLVGTSYVDPVFGATVKRVTTDHTADNIYARNMWWNADETRYYHGACCPPAATIINVANNTVEYTGVPFGARDNDNGFDPVDPNVFYYQTGSPIVQHKITLQGGGTWSDVVSFTPPGGAGLLGLGGTLNWLDKTGRYMVVRYGAEPSVYVYDRNNMGLGAYANPVSGAVTADTNGYIGISPDGQYLVGYEDAVGIGVSGYIGVSWHINHATRTVDAAPTEFWSLCGDHGSFVSASDGRNYMVVFNCHNFNEIWRVDVTNNAHGLDENGQKALPNNLRLLGPMDFSLTGHISTVATGALRDWAVFSPEDANDGFNGGVSPWFLYRSEIIGMNVVTGEVRRLAHHRSRSVGGTYSYQPRVSASWAGKYVGWASNFNQNGVTDTYAVQFALPSAPFDPTQLSWMVSSDRPNSRYNRWQARQYDTDREWVMTMPAPLAPPKIWIGGM